MARRRKEKEPEPIPPPTHIPETYDDLVRSRVLGHVTGRPELDPFGFRQEIGSLRRDPHILSMMTKEYSGMKYLKKFEIQLQLIN